MEPVILAGSIFLPCEDLNFPPWAPTPHLLRQAPMDVHFCIQEPFDGIGPALILLFIQVRCSPIVPQNYRRMFFILLHIVYYLLGW